MANCERHPGTKIINHVLICGAPQCCPDCCNDTVPFLPENDEGPRTINGHVVFVPKGTPY